MASYVVVAVVLLTKTVSCDGVGVQWQNGDLCGASLVLAVLCGTPPPFCGTLKFFALALLVCEFEDRRALYKNRKHKHKHIQ